MRIDINKAYTIIATINFAIVLVGYQFFSALISPFVNTYTGTQWLTIPFRGICLIISLAVIFGGSKLKIKWTTATVLLTIYWVILIIRLICDFYFSPGLYIDKASKNKTLLFIFGTTLPQILSVIQSWEKVNYKLMFKMCLWMIIIAISINLLLNPKIFNMTLVERLQGGEALNSIEFGYLGLTLMLLSSWLLMIKQWNKIIAWLLIIVGAFVMLRSGSRGPIVSTLVLFGLFYVFKQKKISTATFFIGIIAILLIFFYEDILLLVKVISPLTYRRITETDILQSNRNWVFIDAWHVILNYPFGRYFTEYWYGVTRYCVVGYAHNTILDAGIVAGYLGMATMVYFYYVTLKNFRTHILYKSEYTWLILLILLRFMACLLSNAFWQYSTISIGIILLSLLPITHQEERTEMA